LKKGEKQKRTHADPIVKINKPDKTKRHKSIFKQRKEKYFSEHLNVQMFEYNYVINVN